MRLSLAACISLVVASLSFGQIAFQGFETGVGDLNLYTPPYSTATRVPSGGGTLHVPSFAGSYHAEITNIPDDYLPGFGDSAVSRFGFPAPPPTQPYPGGDFSQSISMYIFANWPTAIYNGPGVWIDMSPAHPSGNYGAEHNFRLTPTGTAVQIFVDGQTTPIATLSTTGWYTFQMTFRKGATPTSLVSTDMNVYDAGGNLLGTTVVQSTSPGGPLLSQDLGGPGYVWITVWPNGWANNILAIDNVRADFLQPPGAYLVGYMGKLSTSDGEILLTNSGASGTNLCANVYVLSADEQLLACCSCNVTPNGLVSLSGRNDLISNTLTPSVPNDITVAIIGSQGTCNPANPTALSAGLAVWGTTTHATPTATAVSEISYISAGLSSQMQSRLTSLCGFVQANGSGYGLCRSCRTF